MSLYFSLHLWLVFALFLALRSKTAAWKPAALGFCAALGIQVLIGFWQFSSQSTSILAPLHLNWPGPLDPSVPGASVVQLLDGSRWMRVYGTLPHPNLLGTFLLIFLSGPALIFLTRPKYVLPAWVLFGLGLALIVVTFSRSAWIGLIAGCIALGIRLSSLDRKRLAWLSLASGLSLVTVIVPMRSLLLTRITGVAIPTESFSIEGRSWLIGQALELIQTHPLLGGGAASFIFELARKAPYGYIVEPVHNLPLLITSDLGLIGALLLAGLGVIFIRSARQIRNTEGLILNAAVIALATTSLFDHSLWTLAPGRILLGFLLGLWAGNIK